MPARCSVSRGAPARRERRRRADKTGLAASNLSVAGLLLILAARGARLVSECGEVYLETADNADLDDKLLARLRTAKPELLEVLANPQPPAKEAWLAVLKEVADKYETTAAVFRAAGREPPCLDEKTDDELSASVRESLKVVDDAESLHRILRGIERWRSAWLACLRPQAPSPAQLRHVRSPPLALFDLTDDESAPEEGREAARLELHRRAEALAGPPPNPTVGTMLEAAKERHARVRG